MLSAYVVGDIFRYTSGASNQCAPTYDLKAQPKSLSPASSRKL